MVTLNDILIFYKHNQPAINLIKDITFFIGLLAFFKTIWLATRFLKERRFNEISKKITNNLHFREKIEPLLNDYIFESSRKDIALRTVYWRNYPWNLTNDGYKQYLHINFLDNKPHYGWIDNTSLYFYEWPKYSGSSIYIDKKGIYFFDEIGRIYKNFHEIADCLYVLQLPFEHIVNYDFREKIEYEPALYVKYPSGSKYLFADKVLIIPRNLKDGYYRIEVSQKNKVNKKSIIKYIYLNVKFTVLRYIKWLSNKN